MSRSSWPLVAVLLAFSTAASAQEPAARAPGHAPFKGKPTELVMRRGASVDIDVRDLPITPRRDRFRPEHPDPKGAPIQLPGGPQAAAPVPPERSAPAPAPSIVFEGLDREELGFGSPPDTNGDAGPVYYVQTVNAAIGIYRKSDGFREAGFTFDALMSQGNFGNFCDTDNFGDPVVLYDSFEDRWILTDFAFQLDGSGNVSPQQAFQCFAVSKTGDPITGGWNFYSIETLGGLGDYPKFGIWPDGLYMTASMFDYAAAGSFQNPRVWAFNKAQMYAGDATVQVVSFDGPAEDFTILPANARLQTGTPPLGSPNYYVSTWEFLNALTVYKFHVDWAHVSLSTFTGPDQPLAATSWPNANVANAPQPGTTMTLDTLQIRAMMQNQYSRIGAAESLWVPHTVRRANTTGFAAPRWYQVDVTGGTVAANLPQATTWDPDGANVLHRFMPSLAVDRAGDLALGYSVSSSTVFPGMRYAGRLAGDPVNTFSQTEQTMFTGTASQTGIDRWGDYSAMTLDPDGCTFWYTNEYANPLSQTFDKRWKTKIAAFKYDSCVPVGNGGTVSGTVTALVGGAPISGATVQLGARSTTTNGSGFYSFANVPAGTYPTISASKPGFVTGTSTNVVVTDANTTTRNFALAAAPTSACLTDTTQTDFQTGAPTNVDLVTSPGNVVLAAPAALDQHADDNGFGSGYGFTNLSFAGQTFTPAISGALVRVDAFLFCATCSGANPNITLEVRTTSGGNPVMTAGGLLATATIPGSASGSGGLFTFNYGSPATLVAGTQYGLVVRLAAARVTGTQAWLSSSGDVYAGGRRKVCTTASCANPTGMNANSDLVFKTFMNAGYAPAGDLVSAVKDANPATGSTPTWSTISWTASVPANTTLRFQVAGSTAAGGPWSFVGPGGTAATFYTTSGGSLTQFNGKRYLRYKAYLSTTNSAATPTLNDVTLCFADINPPDLSITKSDGGASVAPGGTVAYTLTYANGGTGGATGVVITDVVPANTTFNAGASTAGWACSPNNNAGSSCTLAVGSLGAGSGSQTATFAVTVVNPVAAGVSQISNTASIADDGANGTDPTPGNNSGSDTTPVTGAPDLSITKSDGGASVPPGGTVSYTLTYANSGNRGATGVVLTDVVPANTTFNAGASTAGWVCAPNNNAGSSCTLTVGGLAAGGGNQTATYAVTVVNPVGAGVSQISNTATIADNGTNGTDPNSGNNSGSDTTPLTGAPDLSLTKSDGGASVAPGGTVSYTLTYANGGNRGASGVAITETVPANTTFNAGASTAGWSCTPNNNAGSSCTLNVGTLAAGGGNQTATFAVTVINPVAAGVTQISNSASIADDGTNGTDPNSGNNSGSDTTSLTGAPDLSITKSDGGASVAPGGTVSYTLTYANGGNRGATGVVLTDTVPANTTFNAGASTAGWSCSPNNNAGSSCTLAVGGLTAGSGNQTATFAVTVANPVPAGVSQISNTATIADDGTNGTDPNGGNNSGSDTTPLTGAPDLSLTKSDGGASVAPGGTVSYTLTYANGGNRGAAGVVITETVPSNTTFNAGASTAGWSCTPNNNAGSTCTLSIGTLAAGGGNQTATFAVTVVNPVGAGVSQISNTASIADNGTNGTDPNSGNNSGSDTTPLTGAPDLSLTKSDGGASVAPGGTVSYTLTYANGGNRGASGVALTETVPANTTFNAGASTAGWSCAPNNNAGSTCTLTIGTLAAGGGNQTATFAVTVVNPVAAGVSQISNTASIADDGTNGTDPNSGNNSGSDTTPVTGAPDLSLTKSDGGASVAPGGTVSYTLTYANSGNRGASGVVLTDTVPANTTFNAGASTAGWSCAPNNNAGSTCTLTIGTLAAGGGNQTATFAVTVVNPIGAGVSQISNTASITDDGTNGTDPTPGNNSGSDTTPLTGGPDLSITKSDGGVSVVPGNTVSYTLTYANGGNRGATGVVLTDTVPANTSFNSGASTAGWSCTPNNNAGSSCTLAVGGLAAGSGPQTATFAVTVVNPVPGGTTQISNTASIADDGNNGTDPDGGNNSGSDTTPLTGADLSITKDDSVVLVSPSTSTVYSIVASNAGPAAATGATVTDNFPAALTCNWTCAGSGGGICGAGSGSGNIADTVDLSVGGSVTYTATCTISSNDTGNIVNTATVATAAGFADPQPGNNSATDLDKLPKIFKDGFESGDLTAWSAQQP